MSKKIKDFKVKVERNGSNISMINVMIENLRTGEKCDITFTELGTLFVDDCERVCIPKTEVFEGKYKDTGCHIEIARKK